MWSRRFERGIVLKAPDRRLSNRLETLSFVLAGALIVFGAIDPWARAFMASWLFVGAVALRRQRRQEAGTAIWRPGRGWHLDMPGTAATPARLHRSTRVLPLIVALNWVLPDGRRACLLAFRWQVRRETFRRLRVLLRYGRGDG
jgi:hypothetical protein